MRVASQLTFCAPQEILRRTVVEINEQHTIKALWSLDNGSVESAQTLFFDGIISAEVISVKQCLTNCSVKFQSDYQYVDLTRNFPTQVIVRTEKPLLLDFGTNAASEINQKLTMLIPMLEAFSAFEIIAACTYYPAVALGLNAALTPNRQTSLVLWENIDLVNKKVTLQSKIRLLN